MHIRFHLCSENWLMRGEKTWILLSFGSPKDHTIYTDIQCNCVIKFLWMEMAIKKKSKRLFVEVVMRKRAGGTAVDLRELILTAGHSGSATRA